MRVERNAGGWGGSEDQQQHADENGEGAADLRTSA